MLEQLWDWGISRHSVCISTGVCFDMANSGQMWGSEDSRLPACNNTGVFHNTAFIEMPGLPFITALNKDIFSWQ